MARGKNPRKILRRRNPSRRVMKVSKKPTHPKIHMNLHTKFKKRKIPKITTHVSSTLPY